MPLENPEVPEPAGRDARQSPDLHELLATILAQTARRQLREPGSLAPSAHHPRYELRAARVSPAEYVVLIRERPRTTPAPTFGTPETVGALAEAASTSALTPRQIAILELVAAGETDKAIACKLGISHFTVSKHVANILERLHVSSRTEATVKGIQDGLIRRHAAAGAL